MNDSAQTWHLIVEPKYRVPSVLNLHNFGRFNGAPFVTTRAGACIVANELCNVAVAYKYLTEAPNVYEGKRYTHMTEHGRIILSPDYAIDLSLVDREVEDIETRTEIASAYKSWTGDWLPTSEDGRIDLDSSRKKVTGALREAKKKLRAELKRKNESWINARLPAIRQNFARWPEGPIIAEDLFKTFEKMGGIGNESGLMKKIAQFYTICFTTKPDGLERLDGNTWQNEDEIWSCWLGFMEDETEANVVFQAMEQVFKPSQV